MVPILSYNILAPRDFIRQQQPISSQSPRHYCPGHPLYLTTKGSTIVKSIKQLSSDILILIIIIIIRRTVGCVQYTESSWWWSGRWGGMVGSRGWLLLCRTVYNVFNANQNTWPNLDKILKLGQIWTRYSKIFSFAWKTWSYSPADSTNRFIAKNYLSVVRWEALITAKKYYNSWCYHVIARIICNNKSLCVFRNALYTMKAASSCVTIASACDASCLLWISRPCFWYKAHIIRIHKSICFLELPCTPWK